MTGQRVGLTLLSLLGACAPPSPGVPDDFLESRFDAEVRWVALGDDVRRGVIVPADVEKRIVVRTGPGSRFLADVAVVPDERPPGLATRLEVGIERAGGTSAPLHTEFLSSASLVRTWKPISVDLGSTSLGEAVLVLRSVTIGRGVGPQIALANPMLVRDPGAPAKPNLILLVVDTLRADHLGAYGHERPTSPFVDELARGGVLFERVVAQSSWTKTSVPSMLTSTYPETNGVRRVDDRLSERFATLAETLREEGYVTLAVQTNPWLRIESGAAHGFMEYAQPGWEGGAARVNELALDALRRRPHRPFFLYLHYMDVHDPYTPLEDYRQFGAAPVDLYDGEIRQLDDQLSEFYDTLARFGLLADTLIALTSDHGEEFGEHGGRFHGGTLYEEQVRVPWILHWRHRLPEGRREPRLVRNLDIAPTLLSLVGIEIPPSFQGVDVLDSARDRARQLEDLPSISQVGLNDIAPRLDLLALTTSQWKLIVDRASGRRELYDLGRDPFERSNLAGRHHETLTKLERTIAGFVETSRVERDMDRVPLGPEVVERLRSLGYLR